jgi:hypothetical protein
MGDISFLRTCPLRVGWNFLIKVLTSDLKFDIFDSRVILLTKEYS